MGWIIVTLMNTCAGFPCPYQRSTTPVKIVYMPHLAREAVRRLHDSDIFVECYDIDSLEDELKNRATAVEYLGRLPQIYETKLAGPWQ